MDLTHRKELLESYLDELVLAKQIGHRYVDLDSIDDLISDVEKQISMWEVLHLEG